MKLKTTILAFLLTLTMSLAHAEPDPEGGHRKSFLDGVSASTTALFMSQSSERVYYKQLLLIGAADDAAYYFLHPDFSSSLLSEAMRMESTLLSEAGEAGPFSQNDLAYLIMKRATLLE